MSTPPGEPRWYHVSPHGYYDLVRLARRGRTTLVRVLYILALFAALAIVYYGDANERVSTSRPRFGPQVRIEERQEVANRNARIAERFCITILVMQNLAVLVLMPIYIAASVQEERDTNTLPILFTTHLTGRMIVLGKWLSRVAQVGSVLLAGLPIMAFAQLWGGIDMPMIAANFMNTACLLVSVGALSIWIAISFPGLVKPVAITYVLAGVMTIGSSCCIMAQRDLRDQSVVFVTPFGIGYKGMFALVAVLAVFQISAATLLLRQAGRNLDRQRHADPTPPAVDSLPGITAWRNRWWRFPPIPDDVIAWKERYLDASTWIKAPLAFFPIMLLWLWFWIIAISSAGTRARPIIFDDFYVFWVFVMLNTGGMYILLVSFRLAGCLVRERQQQTLEALLVLPFTQREFLISKIKGNLLRYWAWLGQFGVLWLFLTIVPPDQFNACGLLLAFLTHLAFFAMLGLFLSVMCRTTVAAYMSLAVVLFVLLIGTLFVPRVITGEFATIIAHGINPARYWISLCREPQRDGFLDITHELSAGLLLVYLFGTVVLWKLSCRQFARNPCGS